MRACAPMFALATVLLAFLLLSVGSAFAQGKALALAEKDTAVSAVGYLSTLQDPDGTLTLEDVVARRDSFQPIPGPFNVGYSRKGAWWLRITVAPGQHGGGDWLLELTAPYTDMIDVYAPARVTGQGQGAGGDDVEVVHSRTGSLVPFSERGLFSHLFVVRTELTDLRQQDIYIRLAGNRSLTASPTFWRLSPFLGKLTFNVLMVAFILGAGTITGLGSVIFGLWLRSKPFVWYGVYVALGAMVVLGNSGFLTLLLYPLSPTVVLRLQNVVGCLTIMTAAFMVRALFCSSGRNPVASRLMIAIGAIAAICAVIAAFGHYGLIAPFLSLNLLLLCILIPWVAVLSLWRREPAAIWYSIGFIAYGFCGGWFMLMVLGVLPASTFGERGYQIVSVLNMVTMFVGLATSLRAGVRERRSLELQLLRASQQNERELEAAVVQRTLALESEIEARRSAEAALRVALREQRHFLTMVSHEFRAPLASIRVAIAIIERRLSELDDAARREVSKIVRTVGRLSHLIDAFLAEEVLEKSALQPRLAALDLAALAREIAQEQTAVTGRDIQVEAAAVAPVEADSALLRTALENLIGNAVKYTDGGITIAVHPEDDAVAIAVKDCGPPIPQEDRPFLFERYYRASSAADRSGIGIGLSIVQKIAALHGGAARLESDGSGGNIFVLSIPTNIQSHQEQFDSAHAAES